MSWRPPRRCWRGDTGSRRSEVGAGSFARACIPATIGTGAIAAVIRGRHELVFCYEYDQSIHGAPQAPPVTTLPGRSHLLGRNRDLHRSAAGGSVLPVDQSRADLAHRASRSGDGNGADGALVDPHGNATDGTDRTYTSHWSHSSHRPIHRAALTPLSTFFGRTLAFRLGKCTIRIGIGGGRRPTSSLVN